MEKDGSAGKRTGRLRTCVSSPDPHGGRTELKTKVVLWPSTQVLWHARVHRMCRYTHEVNKCNKVYFKLNGKIRKRTPVVLRRDPGKLKSHRRNHRERLRAWCTGALSIEELGLQSQLLPSARHGQPLRIQSFTTLKEKMTILSVCLFGDIISRSPG